MKRVAEQGFCLALVTLLFCCALMVGAVGAEEGNVATLTIDSYTQSYSTLVDAFADAVNISIRNGFAPVIVILNHDFSGAGIGILNADLSGKGNIILDLGTHTYTCVGPVVGSKDTQNQAFHLEKEHTVTIKNGKVTSGSSSDVRMLVQNYANLTLENVELNGSQLDGTKPYTLSNNFGNIVLKETMKIITHENGVAFDVYYWPKKYLWRWCFSNNRRFYRRNPG